MENTAALREAVGQMMRWLEEQDVPMERGRSPSDHASPSDAPPLTDPDGILNKLPDVEAPLSASARSPGDLGAARGPPSGANLVHDRAPQIRVIASQV